MLGLAESIIVARLLGAAGFGLVGLTVATVSFTSRLTSFRMNETMVKFLSDAQAHDREPEASGVLKAGLLTEAAAAAMAFFLAFAAAPLLARWFVPDPAGASWIRLYAITILANSILESASGALQIFDRFRVLAQANVLRRVVTLTALLFGMFRFEITVASVLIIYLIGNVSATSYLAVSLNRTAGERLGSGWWRTPWTAIADRWRAMARFAFLTNIGSTVSLIARDADLLWLGLFRPPAEAGFYRLARELLKIPFAAGSPLIKAIYPELARMVSIGNREEARRVLRSGTKIALAWVVPVSLVIVAAAPWAVPRFWGPEFGPAIPAIWILLVGSGFAQLFFWNRPALLALGRPGIAVKIAAASGLLKVTLSLIAIPMYGYLALAGISSAATLLGLGLSLIAISLAMKEPLGGEAGNSTGGPR